MPTPEQYELGARNLATRARESTDVVDKMMIMGYLGNLRSSQYRTTGDLKAQKLAKNCRRAETKLLVDAIRVYGLDREVIKVRDHYRNTIRIALAGGLVCFPICRD